jgi:hypothetical protein
MKTRVHLQSALESSRLSVSTLKHDVIANCTVDEQTALKTQLREARFNALFTDETSQKLFLKSWQGAPNYLNRLLIKQPE